MATAAGCARRAPEESAPPPPPPRITEERLPASAPTIDFAISQPRYTDSADRREVFVEGSVRNRSASPTREITVRVSGRDAKGNVVAVAEAHASPQLVVPGASARYVVRLPNDARIRTYNVEAIGR